MHWIVLEGLRGEDSIGAPRPDSILAQGGNVFNWPELETLLLWGTVGDINLRYFDANRNEHHQTWMIV